MIPNWLVTLGVVATLLLTWLPNTLTAPDTRGPAPQSASIVLVHR